MDVEKRSIKIFIIESDRFDAVVREGEVKVAVVSCLGDVENWDQLKKIRGSGRNKEEGSRL